MIVKYNPKLKEKARKLRNNATYAERLLWKYLKSKKLNGFLFTRQKPIDKYIVDFYCDELHLILEIDGITHINKEKYDLKREDRLKRLGFNILHFNGYYVIKNIEDTLNQISIYINQIIKNNPLILFKGGNNNHKESS